MAAPASPNPVAFDEADLDGALTAILERGRSTVGGADEMSVTLLYGADADTAVSTGPLAVLLDEWQYQEGHGPCLDAATFAATITVADLRTEARWPSWTRRAVEAGAGSCMAVGLRLPHGIPGSLNLYAHVRAAFSPGAAIAAQALAGNIAVLLAIADEDDRYALPRHRQATTHHRAVIDQAKQLLLRHWQCTGKEAFGMLAAQAHTTGRPVHEVAAALVRRLSVNP